MTVEGKVGRKENWETPRIYFACALHGPNRGPLPEEAKRLYEFVGYTLEQAGYSVYLPHKEIFAPDVPAQMVREHSERKIAESDIVVVYAGLPAIGAGTEMAYAYKRGLPLITILEEGKELEPTPEEISDIIIHFSDENDLMKKLLSSLSSTGADKDIYALRLRRNWRGLQRQARLTSAVIKRSAEIILQSRRFTKK